MRPNAAVFSGFRIDVHDRGGRLLERHLMRNLVVNVGLQALRDAIAGTGFRASHIRAGSDATATTPTMTALVSEEISKEIDRRINTTYGIEQQALLLSGEGNGITFREIAIFEQSTMIARAVISPALYKHSGIQMTFTHTLTLEAL